MNEYCAIDDFYFYKQILAKSPQNRDIHLLTITSYDHQDKQNQHEQIFNQLLFPQKIRPFKFNKPVVLITARVHPGQTPASFTMEGIINFLMNKQDLRANLLRKMFVFMIVPMINVDGVYYGHFRMDIFGKNLNRFYLDPKFKEQPAIYAIKQLANHLCKDNRLSFYFDLHAHNAKKGCFIYGNAINDFVEQVQSQVFCKLFAMNHKGFEYNYCNFSQKHMNAKDTNQDMTKQGCGRVVMYRLANIIHSYSLECGIISANKINMIPDPINTQFQINNKRFLPDQLEDNKDPIYNTKTQQGPLFTEDMYRNLGKNLLVSILDVFDKNPYSRVYNSHYKSMDMLRRITAFEIFHNTQRFRMFQRFVYGKVKNINELIKQVLKQKLHYKQLYNFYFFDDKSLKDIVWPDNIPGLSKPIPKSSSPSKLRKFRSLCQPKKQYEFQFLQILQKNKLNSIENDTITQSFKNKLHQDLQNLKGNDYSSHSSQTEDYSPLKKNEQLFNQQYFLNNEMQNEQQNFISQTDRNFSNALLTKQKKEIHFNSLKLQEVDTEERSKSPQKYQNNESPSVRVRRLLKQDNMHIFSSKQSRKSAVDSRIIDFNIFSKDSLIQSIKQDIKIQLKRQQQRKLIELRSKNTYLSHMGNFAQKITSKQKQRIRSMSVRNPDANSRISGSKIQLPSLGAHFFVISTSNKAINRKF